MNVHDFSARTIEGKDGKLDAYKGKWLLVVNVASKCGLTPQYTGLEALYRKFKDQGFVVLGFPCNQFAHQEPESETAIREFCDRSYGVSFPLFAKIDVNGLSAHPLYRYLKSRRKGLLGREAITWNFTKFLVGRNGAVLRRYSPRQTPEKIEKDVAALV